jgi:hypothetical protein
MTEQQLTENQIQAATGHVVTLLARAKKPLQDADWLMRLPADEISRQTETLTKGLSSDWQSRIIDLYQKMQAWVEARRPKMQPLRTSGLCASIRPKLNRRAKTIGAVQGIA